MTGAPTGPPRPRIEGTGRLEAFSDGVFAIVVTLLILEVRLPEVEGEGSTAFMAAFAAVAPKLLSFAISFVTVAIYWVNHHHFFSRVTHTDWKLLWANNLLLFFLTVVPFSTAVLGDHPIEAVPVAFYGLNLGLAALSFTLMGRYVFFGGQLVDPAVPNADRVAEWRRSWFGTLAYLSTVILAFLWVPAALAVFVVVPIAFVVPTLLRADS